MTPGLYLDIPEDRYHADEVDERPTLSVSIAKELVLECPAYAYLRHPRLGGEAKVPSNDMDRGSLIDALITRQGREVAIIECENWKSPANRELRDGHRAEGRLTVTRKLYDASIGAAEQLARRLETKGYAFDGDSQVTIVWDETARNGERVRCRCRMDHVKGPNIWDLKIRDSVNPRRLTRGHITEMGYDIQGAAYPRALEDVDPKLRGRVVFTLLFCEPDPPYCITPVRMDGSLRELGERKWKRGVNTWERCTRTGVWGDYTDSVVFASAKPWELEEEGAVEDDTAAA